MPDENQLAREEILERNQLLILTNDRVGALFPGQPDVGSETFFGSGAFMTRLHDSATCPGDYHEAGFGDLAPEFHALLVLHARGLSPCRAENRDLARLGVGREQLESIAQLTNCCLDYTHVAAIFDVV